MKRENIKVSILFNIIPKEPADYFGLKASPMGGWLMAMVEGIKKKGIDIDIISPYSGKEVYLLNTENINYYIIPEKNNNSFWKEYLMNQKPDIVHVNGTEMEYTKPVFTINHSAEVIVSIQGIVNEITKYIYGTMSVLEIIKNISLKEIIRGTTPFSQKKIFVMKSKHEKFVLQKADYIIGRTDWDKAFVYNLGYSKKYRHINESLRTEFYTSHKWSYDTCTPYTIFVSQGAQAYKGIDVLFDAIELVKIEYPNVIVNIAGHNPIDNDSLKDKLLLSTYGKRLLKLIKEKNIKNNIEFVGLLNTTEMIDYYLSSHIYVQTSLIENSPNSLGEAMLLGVPSIASYVGGTHNFVKDGVNGILYNSSDSMYLAAKIIELFSNESICRNFSERQIKMSKTKYNREKNALDLIKFYKEIIH